MLSPLLFNMYSEEIFKEGIRDINSGVKTNGVRINNLRYADDAVIITNDLK